MLVSLYVKNFVIMDEVNLDFNKGFSVFTGETGAGKSLLIDAIDYLTGARLDKSVIKQGCDNCVIEGVFNIENDSNAKACLDEALIDYENEIIVSRIINKNSTSIKINHRSVTLTFLKKCLENEVDIHSQHDNQYLLNDKNHINLLDKYINDDQLLNDVFEAYKQLSSLKKEYDNLTNLDINDNNIDYLNKALKEINDIDPKIDEDIELIQIEKELTSTFKNLDSLKNAMDIFDKDDGVNSMLYELTRLLDINNETISSLNNRLNEAYNEINDISDTLKSYLSNMEVDENKINEVQERLFDINKLKRKYGGTIASVLKNKDDLINKIDYLNNKQDYLDELEDKINKQTNVYNVLALKLSKIRKNKAIELEKSIINNLKDLMLDKAKFKIDIKENKPSAKGIDHVEFLVSMNVSSPLNSLSKVASGGELSRLMLGLKNIFASLQGVSTIIFDEIDTGVSGVVANQIGYKMAEMGQNLQVLSVTHLAQVASFATHHYHVFKSNDDETKINVHELNYDERINELALIANASLSASSKSASKELLDANQKLVSKL